MDENMNATMPSIPTQMPVSGVIYASFFQRFVASLIDIVLIGIISGALSAIFSSLGDTAVNIGNVLTSVASASYFVYLTSQRGQTLGKMAMHIKVQNETTGQNLDVVSAILREVVGKFLSSVVLLLGYLWMLWDPKKQTWHDKIARSVVVKVN